MQGCYFYARKDDAPAGVFRRHDKCNCEIVYENGRTRQNLKGAVNEEGQRTKKWEVAEEVNVEPPKKFSSDEQPKGFSPKVLTASSKNDKIEVASNAHSRNLDLEATIKKCIKQDKPIFANGKLAEYFERIPPEEKKYITSMHGTDHSVMLYDQEVDAKILANILRNRTDYHNEEIVLISCHTGNTETTVNCFAQQLSDEMGVSVYAPTRYGAINTNGKYYSSDKTGLKREGEFLEFVPRRNS